MTLELLLYIVNTFAVAVVAVVVSGLIRKKMKNTLHITRKKITVSINDKDIKQ